MPRIPFIEANFADPGAGRFDIEHRLTTFLRKLRGAGETGQGRAEDIRTDSSLPEDFDGVIDRINEADRTRIRRRAARIVERREAASGLTHLRREDRERLQVLKDGARLVGIRSEHHADELAAILHAEMPWMSPATLEVWQAMRRSVREGQQGLRLPPLLLDGPPGIGKSRWARRLGELIGAPVTVIEATGEQASFGVVGSQRGWGGAYPGRLIQTVLQHVVANPVIVVDEVEKAGTPTSNRGQSFGLAEALLPLLEPMTARRWSCPYFQVKFDMSWVAWVLTSNDLRLLPEPLLSRCTVIRLEELSIADMIGFATRIGRARGLSDASIDAITSALASFGTQAGSKPNLRTVSRMLDRAADLEHKPMVM